MSSPNKNVVAEKLLRLKRARFARECAKLQPAAERAEAEEFFRGEAQGPVY